MSDLKDLTKKILEFAQERDWEQFHSPKNLATAVAVEAAELQEIFMWLTEAQSRTLKAEQMRRVEEEVGDVLICLLNFAAQCKIDVVKVAEKKLAKNVEKYPVEKARGLAKKYDEL